MTARAALRVVAAAAWFMAAPSTAQSPLALDAGSGPPALTVAGVLDDAALEEAALSGLPLRMRFRVELWRDQLFDALVEQSRWSVLVAHEPIERVYLAGIVGGDTLGSYGSWAEVRRAVERVYRPPLEAPAEGRYYYIAVLQIETLSLSDLDELERWVRGELQPAVRGGRSVGGAIGTGIRRLFIRILGLPARRYEVRTPPFTVP